VTWPEIFAGVGAITTALALYWGYKHTKRADAVTEKSGIATETREGTLMVIDGLNALIDQWQEAWEVGRDTSRYLQERLDEALAVIDVLKKENAMMKKRYGINGENGLRCQHRLGFRTNKERFTCGCLLRKPLSASPGP